MFLRPTSGIVSTINMKYMSYSFVIFHSMLRMSSFVRCAQQMKKIGRTGHLAIDEIYGKILLTSRNLFLNVTILVLPAIAIWAWLTFSPSFRQAVYNVATARAFGSLPYDTGLLFIVESISSALLRAFSLTLALFAILDRYTFESTTGK
jgi:hypothetical protein